MVLVVALAVWVALAENAHRRSATVVLKDYAALAGDELVRRITVDLGYAGYFEALGVLRSAEHTSELQSLMRSSYAVFCLKKKTTIERLQINLKYHSYLIYVI